MWAIAVFLVCQDPSPYGAGPKYKACMKEREAWSERLERLLNAGAFYVCQNGLLEMSRQSDLRGPARKEAIDLLRKENEKRNEILDALMEENGLKDAEGRKKLERAFFLRMRKEARDAWQIEYEPGKIARKKEIPKGR
jgi:hypothetical protein